MNKSLIQSEMRNRQLILSETLAKLFLSSNNTLHASQDPEKRSHNLHGVYISPVWSYEQTQRFSLQSVNLNRVQQKVKSVTQMFSLNHNRRISGGWQPL